jgi:hypothetical protein
LFEGTIRRAAVALLSVVCGGAQIREASGVTRSGSHLLIADDADVGAYFRLQLPKTGGPLYDLNQCRPERVRLKNAGLAVDTESIGVLADKRVVLISERLRSLVSDRGIVAEYDSELAEMGKRGLEGLAIHPNADGSSRVAVLWEGGYPDFGQAPRPEMKGPWKPLIVVHDVPRHGSVGRVRLRDAVATIELDVPYPDKLAPPVAQRFRAPDLCWTQWLKGGRMERGFIVLLSSQDGTPKPVFRYKWLQRFDIDGKQVGKPIDLGAHLPERVRGANWEGLAWYEPGKSLVLVHEEDQSLPPHAFLFQLPPDWQFTP